MFKINGADDIAADLAARRIGFVLLEAPDLGPLASPSAMAAFVHEVRMREAFGGTITRYAWRAHHPGATDEELAEMARAEVAAFAEEHGLAIEWSGSRYGQRRRWDVTTGEQDLVSVGWMAEAIITGKVVR